jgi:hypothetical protein
MPAPRFSGVGLTDLWGRVGQVPGPPLVGLAPAQAVTLWAFSPKSLSEKWERACGGAFACALRWIVPYRPPWGCAERSALGTAKIPRRRPFPIFQTDSKTFRPASSPIQPSPILGILLMLSNGDSSEINSLLIFPPPL